MESETFYFIIYNGIDRTAITVIDLAFCVDYERDEFPSVNNENFDTPEMAIQYAKALAEKHQKKYIPFESRYNSILNERLSLE